MAEAKPWDAVFERVRVQYYANRHYPPKPTEADLDHAEAQLGCQFPLSYREFARRFGLGGCLRGGSESELHLLVAPESSEPAFRLQSVVESTRSVRKHCVDYYEVYGEAFPNLQFEHLVSFCGGEDHVFLFYPPDVTDRTLRECRIYSSCSSWGFEAFAESFAEWLDRADCYFAGANENEELEARYPVVFKPVHRGPVIPYSPQPEDGPKMRPSEFDVASWLAFNNSTARDLALSIRDENRTDSFPILADALQDAGCAHADLLDACRAGDPDIDGKWVLHVLLGDK